MLAACGKSPPTTKQVTVDFLTKHPNAKVEEVRLDGQDAGTLYFEIRFTELPEGKKKVVWTYLRQQDGSWKQLPVVKQ